jgi:hypothetical protein
MWADSDFALIMYVQDILLQISFSVQERESMWADSDFAPSCTVYSMMISDSVYRSESQCRQTLTLPLIMYSVQYDDIRFCVQERESMWADSDFAPLMYSVQYDDIRFSVQERE